MNDLGGFGAILVYIYYIIVFLESVFQTTKYLLLKQLAQSAIEFANHCNLIYVELGFISPAYSA